jgi:long-chain acyl-CoA synthetase
MGLQVGQVLREAARRSPEACAIVDLGHAPEQRREISYAALHSMACIVARVLAEQGVGRGDRVALVAENSAETAAAWFGVVYAGAAVVPMHLLSAAAELRERFAHAGVKVVLHDRGRTQLVADTNVRAVSLDELDLLAEREPDPAAASGTQRYPLDMLPGDTAMVLYTSGTTGRPKGAAISHASLQLHTLLLLQHAIGLDERSRVLCVLPLSHSYGCRLAMLAPFYARARVVIMPRFDATRCLHALRGEEITWFPGVPTMFTALGQLGKDGGDMQSFASRLDWALCAGAPLADETVRRAEAVLGVQVRQGYGMTEATFSTMNAPPDRRVIGSVGKPAWGVELRIVDGEGRDVPRGQTGQVLVRGPNVMTGYLLDEEATNEALSDGWVHSGDVGLLDEEGRLRIVDRIKDLIIRGGYNVYPSEVENALGAHPDVHDVAVVGRPDTFYGEEVVAVVVARAGTAVDATRLHRFLSERVSRTKLPREYVLVPRLPLGPSGKIHKRTLRDQLVSGELKAEKITS